MPGTVGPYFPVRPPVKLLHRCGDTGALAQFSSLFIFLGLRRCSNLVYLSVQSLILIHVLYLEQPDHLANTNDLGKGGGGAEGRKETVQE